MTIDDMRQAYDAIGIYPELLADMLTGYTCDSYADDCEDLINDSCEDLEDYDDETYCRCRVYHRILNISLSDEDCEKFWMNDFQKSKKG